MGKTNIEALYRLSPVQEGILFHTLESSRSGVYLTQYNCILTGPVDLEQLERAWDAVVIRHPALRTLFSWERRDSPLQIVRETVPLPWEYLDWQASSSDQQTTRWHTLLLRDRERGFDLEKAPLFRLSLIALAENRYRLLWTFHHLLIDGWSARLVLDEVSRYYQYFCAGKEFKLPQAPGYERFISWLDKLDDSADEAYWSEVLKDFTTPTSLVTIQPGSQQFKDKAVSRHASTMIDVDATQELNILARQQRLTLNTLVLGAWGLVLGRYTDSDDVVFGTTVSGRSTDLPSVEHTVGIFINTLPMRVRLSCDTTTVQWLRQIQSQQLRMRDFEQTPLTKIQRLCEVPAGTPLFDTIVVYENLPEDDSDSDSSSQGTLIRSEEDYQEYSNYPLALLILPGETLEIQARFDPRIYAEDFVTRMLSHLNNVLTSIGHQDEVPVSELALSSESELEQLLRTWNNTEAVFPESMCAHQLIEQAVERVPQALALISKDRTLNYSALNQSANKLARHLAQLGVGADTGVGIFFERSVDAVIALLAVLKAGGAYVPMDPTFPRDRLKFVLDDLQTPQGEDTNSGSAVIVTRESLLDQLPQGSFHAVCIDRDGAILDGYDDENLELSVDPDQLAYIIYTSGSTGRPKGVMISHRALVNSTTARSEHYLDPLSGFLLLSSLATDSSVAGLFWALCTGASLVLPRPRIEQDIFELLEIIQTTKVSHLLCVPSLYQLILEHTQPDHLDSMKAIIVAGEPCPGKLLALHRAVVPGVSLYNEYGPSEATVWATMEKLDFNNSDTRVPIGRPINNLTAYILNRQGHPTPLGVPGELYIGGAGLALGYLNQPDRTREVFVRNPFRSDPDPILYKTGDLVRYLDDARIEFLGRVDNQVKIRGYRVELEEIEATLKSHPQVNDAAVVLEDSKFASAQFDTNADQPLVELLLADDTGTAEHLLAEIEQLSDVEIDLILSQPQAQQDITGSRNT